MSTQATDLPNSGLSTQPILDNMNAKFFLGDEEGELCPAIYAFWVWQLAGKEPF